MCNLTANPNAASPSNNELQEQIEMVFGRNNVHIRDLVSFEICSGVAFPYPPTEELYIQRQNLFCARSRLALKAPLPSYTSIPIAQRSHVYFSFLLFFWELWLMLRPRPSVSR